MLSDSSGQENIRTGFLIGQLKILTQLAVVICYMADRSTVFQDGKAGSVQYREVV